MFRHGIVGFGKLKTDVLSVQLTEVLRHAVQTHMATVAANGRPTPEATRVRLLECSITIPSPSTPNVWTRTPLPPISSIRMHPPISFSSHTFTLRFAYMEIAAHHPNRFLFAQFCGSF